MRLFRDSKIVRTRDCLIVNCLKVLILGLLLNCRFQMLAFNLNDMEDTNAETSSLPVDSILYSLLCIGLFAQLMAKLKPRLHSTSTSMETYFTNLLHFCSSYKFIIDRMNETVTARELKNVGKKVYTFYRTYS